ncbi:uncharacterized protein LOC117647870 [Thrips palmi]|uniref:Uncharacterized protein LOC117647870 n=1 Tax=Thrips palmi TaxID=161013 RepID=A0A6P8ZBY6_THRPL|nr:uncharacterized protein LOC117647870 [Thrips palmi]
MYTHNAALDWIHDFDATSPRYPETHAIDWPVPPKPRSGWPVIEGLVLDISSDLEYLKSKADQLTKKDQQRLNSSGRNDNEDAGSSSSERDSNLMDVNSEAFIALVARLSKSHANHSPGSSSSSRSSSFSNRSCSNESTSPPPQQKVSVVKSLCVDKTVYTLALNAGSPGRMVRPLLRQAFSRRRSIASTYAGQKRMVGGTRDKISPGNFEQR